MKHVIVELENDTVSYDSGDYNYCWEIDESLILLVHRDGKPVAAYKRWESVSGQHINDEDEL